MGKGGSDTCESDFFFFFLHFVSVGQEEMKSNMAERRGCCKNCFHLLFMACYQGSLYYRTTRSKEVLKVPAILFHTVTFCATISFRSVLCWKKQGFEMGPTGFVNIICCLCLHVQGPVYSYENVPLSSS